MFFRENRVVCAETMPGARTRFTALRLQCRANDAKIVHLHIQGKYVHSAPVLMGLAVTVNSTCGRRSIKFFLLVGNGVEANHTVGTVLPKPVGDILVVGDSSLSPGRVDGTVWSRGNATQNHRRSISVEKVDVIIHRSERHLVPHSFM